MSKNVVINNVVYNSVPHVDIPISGGGTAVFYEVSDATARQGDILTGKSAYISGGKTNGSMANNGDTSGTISTKAGTVSIPSGYTSGGTASISSSETRKIIAGNIKSGITILGQRGSSNVVDTAISANRASASTIMSGYKAYVNGSQITGSATVPTVSQDGSTHVLTIS